MVSFQSAIVALVHTLTVTVNAIEPNHRYGIAFTPNCILQSRYSGAGTASQELGLATSTVHQEIGLPQLSPTKVASRHHLFEKTNVSSRTMPVPHPEIWKRCFNVKKNSPHRTNDCNNRELRQPFWEIVANTLSGKKKQADHIHQRGIVQDIEVIFEDPSIGAHAIMNKCGLISQQDKTDDDQFTVLPETIMREHETLQHLTNVLSYYQSIVSNGTRSNRSCRARIVSTIGSIGTKCPRWHADHVPLRLVMSLIGPGCEYIPFEMESCKIGDETIHIVNRDALNNLDDDDTSRANDIIVPAAKVEIVKNHYGADVLTCAKAGDAVLLMGRGWEEEDSDVLAAVHRSPRLMDNEERILLTLDVADWDYSHQ